MRALFEGPNYGHVATLLPDGSPHSVAVWVGLEGDEIVFFTQTTSLKARNLERDPRVAISMVDHDDPYHDRPHPRAASRRTTTGDEAWEVIDRLAVRYTGEPFPLPPADLDRLLVEADKVGSTQLPFEHRPAAA